jgi:molecular chaperone GrpE (heat shock protein)
VVSGILWREFRFSICDMSQAANTKEEDLARQLSELVIEAGTRVQPTPSPKSELKPAPKTELKAVPKSEVRIMPGHDYSAGAVPTPPWLQQVLNGIEALGQAHNENAFRLDRIERALAANAQVPSLLAESRQSLDQRNVVNRAMFEALHAELKGYKDIFMLEAVLKPVIRDLISLYDDTCEIRRQTTATLAVEETRGGESTPGIGLLEIVQTMSRNLEHNVHFILEVLERMEVTLLPENMGKLDKRSQRAVAIEAADAPENDQNVIRVVKRGFLCGDRVIRAEEVVIQKWKEGCLVAMDEPEVPPMEPEPHT